MNAADIQNRILRALRMDSKRDIYEAGRSPDEYFISYHGGGPFPRSVVESMVQQGWLTQKYANTGGCYKLA